MGALCCHYCSTIFVYAILNHQNVAKTFRSLYNMDIIEERRTIIGLGPSAATKVIGPEEWRLKSCHFPKDIPTYIQRIEELTAKRAQLIKAMLQTDRQ